MPRRLKPILALALLFGLQPRLEAKKAPQLPEQLQALAHLIFQGKVLSHKTQDRALGSGGKLKIVSLKVHVESVTKGKEHAKTGDTIEVHCWRGVKRPWDADQYDDFSGNHLIPDAGVQATFHLEKDADGNWAAITPNGIEAPPGSPALSFPSEPSDRPLWDLPIIPLLGAATVGLILLAVVWRRRSTRKPGQ